MKRVLRQQIVQTFGRAGGFRQFARTGYRSSRLSILCYHGISIKDEHQWNSNMFLSQEQFRSRLQILRSLNCEVLSLDDAVRRLYSGTLPDRAVSLTFDDGNVDFLQRALPVLQEFRMPATVYWTTFYAGRMEPVFPFVGSYIAWRSGAHSYELPNSDGRGSRHFDITTPAGRSEVARALGDFATARGYGPTEKAELLRTFSTELRVDFEALKAERILQIMTPEEARLVHRAGIDVQLHTHRHRTPDDKALFLRELDDNRRVILETLGKNAEHFCYPSGVVKGQYLPWLTEARVISATTCEPGLASRKSLPLALPRWVDSAATSEAEFESWVSGAGDFFALLARLARGRRLNGREG
ncbi:MAG: polysaccharide deacetylase family protein [Vicinamibacterales bacterium]